MEGPEPFEAEVAPDFTQLRALRGLISSWLESAAINGGTRKDIVLATHEAVANAMEHAQQAEPINVRGEIAHDSVTISVANAGAWQHPRSDELRGRGLALIRALMTDVDVQVGSRVSVVMQRSLSAPGE